MPGDWGRYAELDVRCSSANIVLCSVLSNGMIGIETG